MGQEVRVLDLRDNGPEGSLNRFMRLIRALITKVHDSVSSVPDTGPLKHQEPKRRVRLPP
jgi:hypothetical protein